MEEFLRGAAWLLIFLGYPYAVLTDFAGVSAFLAMLGGGAIVFSWHLLREIRYKDSIIKHYVEKNGGTYVP